MPQFHYTTKWQQSRRTVLLAWAKGSLQAVPQSALPLIFAFVAPELPTQPLRKLTLQLVDSYNQINRVRRRGATSPRPTPSSAA